MTSHLLCQFKLFATIYRSSVLLGSFAERHVIKGSAGVDDPNEADIGRNAAMPRNSADAVQSMAGLMPEARKVSERAMDTFNETATEAACKVLCKNAAKARVTRNICLFLGFMCLGGQFIRLDVVSFNLNFVAKVHIAIKDSAGVDDPNEADIGRNAAMPRNSADAVQSLRA